MSSTFYDLTPGTAYEVVADIVDFHGQVFLPGRRLIYVERHFLPHDDGHTVNFREEREFMPGSFREMPMYLQGDDHRDIIEHTAKYIRPVSNGD
jgi:hypothetical protein